MRLRRLRLVRFRQFVDAQVELDSGVIAAVGPNGAGKSTLLEGVLWALFGARAVRQSEASLRGLGAPPSEPTSAELAWEHDDVAYRVRRTLDDTVLHAFAADDDWHELAAGSAAVTECVCDVLGMSRDAFFHACVTGYRELQQLAQLRPAERLQTLARLLDIEPREGQTQDPVADAIAALEDELRETDDRMSTLASAPELLEQYAAELERARRELGAADSEAERLHDEWSQKRQDVETRLESYRRRGDELTRQTERLTSAGAAGTCPTCEQPLGDDVDIVLMRLDDEVYSIAQDTKWLAQRRAQLQHRPVDLVQAETRRARLRTTVEDRSQRVARCEQAMQELWTLATDRRRAVENLRILRSDQHRARGAPQSMRTVEPDRLVRISAMAGEVLARITHWQYTGLVLNEDGRVYAQAHGVTAPVVSGGDEDLIALALRLAIMRMALEDRPPLGVLFIDEPFGALDADRAATLMTVLRELVEPGGQLIVATRVTDVVARADQVIAVSYSRTSSTAAVTTSRIPTP